MNDYDFYLIDKNNNYLIDRDGHHILGKNALLVLIESLQAQIDKLSEMIKDLKSKLD